jgi:DNA mismatch repair protein MSH4
VARLTYKEATDDVIELSKAYMDTHHLGLILKYSANTGFYLGYLYIILTKFSLKKGACSYKHLDEFESLEVIPSEFLNHYKKGNYYHFTTLKFMCLNDRIQESLNEVYLMSDEIVKELVVSIVERIGSI